MTFIRCDDVQAPTGQHVIAQGNALGIQRPHGPSPERAKHASVPNIPFIKRDAIFGQQSAVFILKRYRAMMLGLIGNVGF